MKACHPLSARSGGLHRLLNCGRRPLYRRLAGIAEVNTSGRWRQVVLSHHSQAWRFAMAFAASASVWPAHAEMPAFSLWSEPQVNWSAPMSAQVWGLPLYYLSFTTQWSPQKTATALSRDKTRFQTFTQLADGLLLSGQAPGQHWLAQLTAEGSGSRGLVSVWLNASSSLEGRPQKSELGALFQPAGLWRTLLHVRQNQAGRIVEQGVYQGKAASPVMLADLEHRLRQAGWQPDEAVGEAGRVWRRSGQRLRWQLGKQADHFMIFMHYSE